MVLPLPLHCQRRCLVLHSNCHDVCSALQSAAQTLQFPMPSFQEDETQVLSSGYLLCSSSGRSSTSYCPTVTVDVLQRNCMAYLFRNDRLSAPLSVWLNEMAKLRFDISPHLVRQLNTSRPELLELGSHSLLASVDWAFWDVLPLSPVLLDGRRGVQYSCAVATNNTKVFVSAILSCRN